MSGLTRLEPSSSFDLLWPWFLLTGLGIGLTMTGATRAILGSAPLEYAGIAAGIQQTSMEIGAALGTAILGTVVTAHASTGSARCSTRSPRKPRPRATGDRWPQPMPSTRRGRLGRAEPPRWPPPGR
jgi:MFS family permease